MRVAAVVVTHNRRALLREALEALRAQTRPLDRILVVDNASADGTAEMLAADFGDVEVLRLAENGGGAGGFAAGLERAYAGDEEWLWVMDDDTIPTPTALAELLAPLDDLGGMPEPVLMASRVLWTDGSMHPMNLPWPRWKDRGLEVRAAQQGLVALRAVSFVSILVRREALGRVGLPRASFFIWGDDIEFTARLLRDEVGYLAPRSVVHHKTANATPSHHSTGPRYYYDVRNKVLMLRSGIWGTTERFWFAVLTAKQVREHLAFNRFGRAAIAAVARGVFDGLFRPPPGGVGPAQLPSGGRAGQPVA